jgi:hypothetical protein
MQVAVAVDPTQLLLQVLLEEMAVAEMVLQDQTQLLVA